MLLFKQAHLLKPNAVTFIIISSAMFLNGDLYRQYLIYNRKVFILNPIKWYKHLNYTLLHIPLDNAISFALNLVKTPVIIQLLPLFCYVHGTERT